MGYPLCRYNQHRQPSSSNHLTTLLPMCCTDDHIRLRGAFSGYGVGCIGCGEFVEHKEGEKRVGGGLMVLFARTSQAYTTTTTTTTAASTTPRKKTTQPNQTLA